MRLLLPLLGVFLLAGPLRAQTVSVNLDEVTPVTAIRTLFTQAKRPYVLIDDSVRLDYRKVSISLENRPFDQVLKELLDAARLTATKRDGVTIIRRSPRETASWQLLRGLYQLQVPFAYDPLKEKVVVGQALTESGLQRLSQLSGLQLQSEQIDGGFSLTVQHDNTSTTRITADFRDTTLDVVGTAVGVAVDPACARNRVTARLEDVPRQKALTIIAKLTKTKLVQRGDIFRFEPAE